MTIVIIIVLILCSALFSGLTLGLMRLDVYEVERKARLGNKQAQKVYPLRKQGNLLLTALLLGNVAVNAALSVFLTEIASGVVAGFIATALIFVFGEIIPQAVISRHALAFGARTAPLVRVLLFVTYPICLPIAWALDKVLGDELRTVYPKSELVELIAEHEDSPNSDLDDDEERILKGALQFSDKTVEDVMTPRTVVKRVKANEAITVEKLREMVASGYSRFPVVGDQVDDILGMLHIRDLVGVTDGVFTDYMQALDSVEETASLDDVLNAFLKKNHHMFQVRSEFGAFVGVITMEDILEEILGVEIVDEDDLHVDMRAVARALRKKKVKK